MDRSFVLRMKLKASEIDAILNGLFNSPDKKSVSSATNVVVEEILSHGGLVNELSANVARKVMERR